MAEVSHIPSSPRLPSPPPFPEVQMAPESPLAGAPSSFENVAPAHGALRRVLPGTRAEEMNYGPPLTPLTDVSLAVVARPYFLRVRRLIGP